MNLRLERRAIGEQSDKSALNQVRFIVNDREVTPSEEQRKLALELCASFDPKPAAKPGKQPGASPG